MRAEVQAAMTGDKGDSVSAADAASSPPPGLPTTADRSPQELERHFRQLVRKWIQETEYMSSAARMAEHPTYQEIIKLGEPAVPLLLAELRRRPDFWFAALRAITGENPVPPQSAGKVQDMATAWLAWGQAKGLIP
jgi:hypothetical protein